MWHSPKNPLPAGLAAGALDPENEISGSTVPQPLCVCLEDSLKRRTLRHLSLLGHGRVRHDLKHTFCGHAYTDGHGKVFMYGAWPRSKQRDAMDIAYPSRIEPVSFGA